MKQFLHYVAQDIVKRYGTDLSRVAVVFPGKRASLFMSEYLAQTADKPVWAPQYLTIRDLFGQFARLDTCDPIKAVCELFKSYTAITGRDETLDRFYDWGQVLINDFDDIDKHMAQADKVFANLANIHELDDVTYLSDEQKETLKRFFSNFSEDHNSKLRDIFINLWNKLGDIYNDFRERLQAQGLGYEGMVYRDVVENKLMQAPCEKYIFVGFNLLQQVEVELFSYFKQEGKAEFYWDFDRYYMPQGKRQDTFVNEAGRYIARYMDLFGSALDPTDDDIYDNFRKKKDITFISAKTEDIQARYIDAWLQREDRVADGRRTAVVMCDENLLATAIHCIPDTVSDINITTGYPLAQAPVATLISQLLDLRILGTRPDGRYRLSYVRRLLNTPYAPLISPQCHTLLQKLEKENNWLPTHADLAADEGLALLFTPTDDNTEMLAWLTQLLATIGKAGSETSPFFQESVFTAYTMINRLLALVKGGDLNVDKVTMQKLVKQLISSTSIPFHGEPAIGLQMMGVLETRNIDFNHVLLLSCNEGNMPKGIKETSFIPYSIRKAYGLTTVDNKVAIYSYYFHRLLQRASDITILYNTSTENGNRGEMSRFMLQLMAESGHGISMQSLHARQNAMSGRENTVEKSDKIMRQLYAMERLSPTAINRYLKCGLQFYYYNIAGIAEPDEDNEENLSSRAFGNIFHNTAEAIYREFLKRGHKITESDIARLQKNKAYISQLVDQMFEKEIYGRDINHGKGMVYNGMQLINREVIIRYIMRLLEVDKQFTPFQIHSLEEDFNDDIVISTADDEHTLRVGGRVDRVDIIRNKHTGKQTLRVIDYKTGGHDIERPIEKLTDIFDPRLAGGRQHTDYYLQAMLYSIILSKDQKSNQGGLPVSPALIFIQKAFSADYVPTLCVGKKPIDDVSQYAEEYRELLKTLVEEIFNRDIPFAPTANRDLCEYCPYIAICKKMQAK